MESGWKMYVDAEFILQVSKIVGAIAILGGLLYEGFKFMERQKAQDVEIEEIKKEQCVLCYAILATLDGLKQLGANGNVTDAHEKLEKHLNQSAHDWGK